MHIVHDIAVLDIAATIMGKMTVIHPTLLRDDVGAVLVDTGFPGQPALIRAAMEEAGAPCSSPRAAASTPGHRQLHTGGHENVSACFCAVGEAVNRGTG